MTYCAILKDKDGNVKKVVKDNGMESTLYTTIAKHPLVTDQNMAVDLFKNKFSNTIVAKDKEYGTSSDNTFVNMLGVTQDFFSDVSNGALEKYKPAKPYEYELEFNPNQEAFKVSYDSMKGSFDEHIATSIPTFRDVQVKKGAAIVDVFSGTPTVVNQELYNIRQEYIAAQNLPNKERSYTKVDKQLFSEIAEYHKNVKDDRDNAVMQESYKAFLDETLEQFRLLEARGYTLEPWEGEGEPYGVYSDRVRKDINENKRLYYLKSEAATGTNDANDTAENYAPFRPSGVIRNGKVVPFNDLFRAVHDVFGHGMRKNSFSTQGELDAYTTHASMYSEKAQKALFLETVVYNAWYSENKNYAPRKIYDIPQDFIDRVVNGKPKGEALMYDLGGSEGGFVKTITKQSNGTIRTVNLDSNSDMAEKHEATPVEGSEVAVAAFQEGFGGIPRYEPQEKGDIVHESMLFQFISKDRKSKIKEIKDHYLKEDGVFITEEKFQLSNKELQVLNEKLKDSLHKSKYYTQQQIQQKGESVLVGMEKHQANFDSYIKELKQEFKYVSVYWTAGNFRGIIATNNKSKHDSFLKKLGDTGNQYNAKESDIKIETRDSEWEANAKENLPESNIKDQKELETLLTNGTWGLLTAENPNAKSASDLLNKKFNKEAKEWLESRGYTVQPIFGKYGTPENSFLVEGLTVKDAIEFATQFDQESVATSEGLVFKDGTVRPLTGVTVGQSRSDMYSTIRTKQGLLDFYVEYDFEQTLVPSIEGIEERLVVTHRLPDGSYYESYKEALKNTEEGQPLELGFLIDGEFFPIVTAIKNTNKNTQEGYVNNMIVSGYLSDQKVKSRGEYVYEAAGESEMQKIMSAEVVNEDSRAYLGTDGVKKDGFTFRFDKKGDRLRVLDSNGNIVEADRKDVETKTYRQLEAEHGSETALNIIAEREWHASRAAYRDGSRPGRDAEPATSEEELQLRLLNFLNKLGVKTISISEYVRKYKAKNKVNPSAKALADIANQVVAVLRGEISIEDLAEETAHFINEAMPQDQVREVLENIHLTEEWAEFSDIYREIYRDEYPADQLEEVVRREVLGKVVAKAIVGNFGNNTLEMQKSIFRRVMDFVMDFFRRVANFYTPSKGAELQQYLKDVEKLLSQEDITDTVNLDNFKHNTFRFYSIEPSSDPADKLRKKSLALVEQLKDAEKTYMKAGSGRRTNIKELDKIQDRLERAVEVNSIASLISMLNSSVRGLEAAIKDSEINNKPYFLTDEENILYQFIKGVGKKGVGQIKELVTKVSEKDKSAEWKPLIKELTETSEKITSLEAKAELLDSKNVGRLVEEMMNKHNIPEQDRHLVEKWIDRAQADTNLFHATFGQLVHAKDGLLNLGGNIIRKMHNEAQVDFFNATKNFQDKLRELGVTEQEIDQKFVDGNYIISEFDFNKFDEVMDGIFADTYKQTIQESIPKLRKEVAALEAKTELSPVEETQLKNKKERLSTLTELAGKSKEELINLKRSNGLESLTLEEETRRKNLERPLKVKEIERPMVEAYYEEYENNLKEAGVSDITKQELSNLLGDISDIKKKAFRKEGDKTILDYNSLSETDLIRLSDLQRKRKAMKSFTDELGRLKPGLKYMVQNGSIVRDEFNRPVVMIANRDLMTPESIVAWDINNLDNLMDKKREKKSAQLFYDTLDRIDREEGREAALRFLEVNSYMSFSQEFWDSMGNAETIVDRLSKLIPADSLMRRDINRLKNNIILATFEMKNSLKTFNKKGNPAEIDVDMMTTQVKEFILDKKEEIDTWISQAKQYLTDPDENVENEEDFLGVSEPNEAYRQELKNEELLENENDTPEQSLTKAQQEVDFAAKHMTRADQKRVADIQYSINSYRSGRKSDVSRSTHTILDDLGYNVEDLADPKVHAEVLRVAVRQRLAPYYKRFTSKAYTQFYESLKKAPVLSEALQGQLAEEAMVEVNPNYSFYDQQENDKVNPNFDRNFEGGYLQPKKGEKYKNTKFKALFGEITTDEQGNKVSTKNPKLYQAYLATLEYNRAALDAMNIGENHNKFLLPQIRKNKIERFSKFLKGNPIKNVRNFSKDVLAYTEDEMIQGEDLYGKDVKVIPKMYVRRLEDPEDVSNDLFHSLTLRAKEGFLRKAKVKSYGDLMSIHDKILTRDMNGKSQEASNTYKMFKSAIDYNLFGIKETATYPIKTPIGVIDLTKIARTLLNYVKFRNLGLNVVIPLTSLITGSITRKIEAATGEFIDTRSQRLGAREFAKIGAEGMKEIGVVNTRAKINVLGQFYKAFDLQESFANSNYGYLLRNMPRVGMALHAAANYPLYGKTMLGILHDFRVVDGQVMNKNKFKRIKAAANLSKEDLESQWKSYENKAIYNFIKHDGNKVSYDKEALGRELLKDGLPLEPNQLDSEINEIHNEIQGNIQYVNSIIDGQIPEEDRVYAQRHYLLSYFMTHRGWLSIAMARKFKSRHLNLDTGVVEEGSYRSLFNYLGDYVKEFREGNRRALIGNFREAWRKGDEVQRKNIKRVGIELGALSTLMLLGLVLRTAAEDDDNEDLFALQLSNYLAYRTLNELSSVQFNIVTNFSDTIESPFVGWSTMKNLFDVGDLLSGEEVKYGTYRGMTEREKYITKMVPGMKQIFDLQNMHQTYDTYKFYNQSNFSLTPVNLLWDSTIDKKE